VIGNCCPIHIRLYVLTIENRKPLPILTGADSLSKCTIHRNYRPSTNNYEQSLRENIDFLYHYTLRAYDGGISSQAPSPRRLTGAISLCSPSSSALHVPIGRTWTCRTAICPGPGRAGPWAWRAGPRTGRTRPATRADSCKGAGACGPGTRLCRRARCRRWWPRRPGTTRNRWWTLPAPCTLTAARWRWSRS